MQARGRATARLIEQALRASEDRFATAFYASPIAMAITTVAEGRYIDVNDAFLRQMGYARDEVCGRTSLELNVWPSPSDRAAMIATLQRQKVLRDQHAQFRTKSGSLITTRYSAGLITLDRQPCVLAAIADFTGQELAERARRESEANFQALATNSPFGIMVGGRDHRVRFCNPAFQRIFQYTDDDVIGKDPDELVGLPGTAEATEISRRVLSGEAVHVTTKRRRKDGRAIDVEVHAIPLMAGNEFAGCFGIYQDITERVEAETKLQVLRGRLARVQDEERAHIARELHDDIGQRLALLTLLLAELEDAVRNAAPALATRLEEATSLTGAICNDVSRLSHRLHPSHTTLLGLPTALASFCQDFTRQTGLAIDFVHGEIPRLAADVTTCLYRVVQEAVHNAHKHSGATRVRVELAARPDAIWLRVSDSGRGFDPHTVGSSSGLGLVSMAERVRGVAGELSILSAVDQGTRLEVSIPFAPDARADVAAT